MVLGLYYITKERKSSKEHVVKGEGMVCYSPRGGAHRPPRRPFGLARVAIKMRYVDAAGNVSMIDTTCGRVLFNEHVPQKRDSSTSC